jgi:hypothetical protein
MRKVASRSQNKRGKGRKYCRSKDKRRKKQESEEEKAEEEQEKAGLWTREGPWWSSNKDIEEEQEKAEAWTWGGTWGSRSLKNRRNMRKQRQGQEED